MSLYLFLFLRFAIGNRRARSWQPYGPQPETGQPAIEKRSFTPFRTVFYTIHKRKKDGMKQEKQQVFPTFLTLLFLYLPRSAALSAGCPAATRLHHNGLQTLYGCHSSALSCPMRRNSGQSSRQNHRRAHRLRELPPTCGRVFKSSSKSLIHSGNENGGLTSVASIPVSSFSFPTTSSPNRKKEPSPRTATCPPQCATS